MLKMNHATFAASSLLILVSAAGAVVTGCAHPQTVTLTSASAAAPGAPAAVAPPSAAPTDAENAHAADAVQPSEEAPKAVAESAATKDAGAADPMSFAALSAALGDSDKMSLDVSQPVNAPASKGLSADGYTAVAATHQALDTGSATHAGDMKVGGGMTAAAIRAGVQEGASRLRACYAHGLVSNPHLAGRIMVSFSVDAQGAASGVTTDSDAIPADVMGCVRDAFSSMTFAPPKTAPAKIVYPVDFNKDS